MAASNPGPQNISVNEVIANLPFISDTEWEKLRTKGNFDYVIIGSSFCALGFIHQILEKTTGAKIFVIERGDYVSPEKFQNLTPLQLGRTEKVTETIHWKISQTTSQEREGKYIESVRGMNNLFGGRSSFWKAWCPQPNDDEMDEWPKEVIQSVHKYSTPAKELLNVKTGNDLFRRPLQGIIFEKLQSKTDSMEEIKEVQHVPLAVAPNKSDSRYGDDRKYSVLEPLLDRVNNGEVKAIVNCLVKKIHHDENNRAVSLDTSKGEFILGKAKLILAMSTLPSTTLMLNSFSPSVLPGIGTRFTAHFMSSIYARIPIKNNEMYSAKLNQEKLDMAAIYVTGESARSKHQFHIQLTAVAVTEDRPLEDYDDMRHLLKTPRNAQLASSKGHIVFICASLGQLDHDNADNWFRCEEQDGDGEIDITCNATLQVIANDNDRELWDTMDKSTFKILECLGEGIEYWIKGKWTEKIPDENERRYRSVVHPASTMWIGEDSESPVNPDYEFQEVKNVYLTGGALWPTGASFNPTCTMTAMAMDLADKLTKH